MKAGEAIIRLFAKYEFKKEIPAVVREKMLFSKKSIYNRIMDQRCGKGAYTYRGNGMNKNMMILVSAAAVVMIAAVSVLLITKNPGKHEAVDQALAARAVFITGDVTLKRGAESSPLKPGDRVGQGDVVVTGANSFASLQVNDLGVIKINSATECSFTALSAGGNTELLINRGAVYSSLKKLKKEQTYKVSTGTYTAAVRGTQFLTSAGDADNSVKVLDGIVYVVSGKGSVEVLKESGVRIEKDGTMKEYKLSEIEILELKKESLFGYMDNAGGMDKISLDTVMQGIMEQMAEIDKEIAGLTGKNGNPELSPLDKLRSMNKPLTMLHLRDGSQIAGNVRGQKNGKLILDTGAGVINIPVEEILRRVPFK